MSFKSWGVKSWLDQFVIGKEPKNKKENTGYVYYLGNGDKNKFVSLAEEHALNWQLADLKKNERELVIFTGVKGPVWIVRPRKKAEGAQHQGLLEESDYAFSRDLFGALIGHFRAHALKQVRIEFAGTEFEQEMGALVGLEISTYSFRQVYDGKALELPTVSLMKNIGDFEKSTLLQAKARAQAVNVARHLVNLPPNDLNPKTFVEFVKGLALPATMKMTVHMMCRTC